MGVELALGRHFLSYNKKPENMMVLKHHYCHASSLTILSLHYTYYNIPTEIGFQKYIILMCSVMEVEAAYYFLR
jgi:hypothetical protein